MKKRELKNKLHDIEVEVRGVLDNGGVIRETALYAFLRTASTALSLAQNHYKELNEQLSK